jgi:hypothetical protein
MDSAFDIPLGITSRPSGSLPRSVPQRRLSATGASGPLRMSHSVCLIITDRVLKDKIKDKIKDKDKKQDKRYYRQQNRK